MTTQPAPLKRRREWVYRPIIWTALLLFRVLDFRFTVIGEEHVPTDSGAVMASNHVSFFDYMFVGLAAHPLRRLVRFMAKKSIFEHPVAGPLMRGMHHISVDRAAGAGAFREAARALQEGELVGIFPEQTISRSFELRPLKSGAARLAIETGTPLVPVVVWGGHRVWTAHHKPVWRRHVPVIVSVGAPLEYDADTTADELTERLTTVLSTMLEGVQRSYPAVAKPGDDWWQPAYLGGTAPTPAEGRILETAAIAGRQERKAAAAAGAGKRSRLPWRRKRS